MQVVEHLVLSFEMAGFTGKYKAKHHDNLGGDLQGALEVLEREGWEVVAANGGQIILKRLPR
jgi:hypothetical protein